MIASLLMLLQAAEEHHEDDLGTTIMHHVVDGHELELPGTVLHLPSWPAVELGPFVIDFSPTKHAVFLLITAVIVGAVMLYTARRAKQSGGERVPGG
ncbi:MAG TPA: hypothetical protein VNZ57_12180, partial [Longimicrobiales bacterium]|nr:hypothetical protein [Longimicrobiales bacterium]